MTQFAAEPPGGAKCCSQRTSPSRRRKWRCSATAAVRLFELLQSLGRPMDDCGTGKTPLAVMLERESIDERWIVVHLNELTRGRSSGASKADRAFTLRIAHAAADIFSTGAFALRNCATWASTSALGPTVSRAILRSAFSQKCEPCETLTNGWSPRESWKWPRRTARGPCDKTDALGKIRAGFQADLIALPIEDGSAATFTKRLSRGASQCRGCWLPASRSRSHN